GGAIADRMERRRLMLIGQAVVTATAITLAVTTFLGPPPVPLIFLLAGCVAGGSTIDNVTRSAVIPALAGDRLRAALSINYGLYQVAAVVGPGLGGVLVAALGTGAAYTAQAIGFVIMMGVTLMLPRFPPPASDVEPPHVLRSIAEGLRFVRR